MSQQYYVVSEDELRDLSEASSRRELSQEWYKAKAACHARPVNAVPGRSTKGEGMCWIEEEV